MSSKVLSPDDVPSVTPIAWRRVATGREVPLKVADEVERDLQNEIRRLERQWEQRVRDAHGAGLREGEAAGHSRAAADLQPVFEKLARAIEGLAQLRPRLRRDAEADMVKLALAIARRVLRRELVVDPDALHGLVLGALEKLQGQEICRVKVHPSHAENVRAALQQSHAGSTVEIVADSSCAIGGIIFETARGNLDASVDSQLQEIERGLADRLRKNS
jgi:flagellar assembly protein FliH